jgi:hypothetical protein
MTPAQRIPRTTHGLAWLGAVFSSIVLGFAVASPATATVTQPRQPLKGPGGSQSAFGGVRVTTGGSGYDAWEILEPTNPAPPSAPLVVVMHGYYEFSGYSVNGALARHVAQKGNVVIYPRWQTGVATPCPGPINIKPCVTSAATAIHAAIAFLHAHLNRVQPRTDEASYFGFSFGGIITANMLNEYRALGLPKPHAVFLDDPHDGALTGPNEPALDASLGGIPSSAKFICHAGADGVISGTDSKGESLQNAGCNAVFPKLGQIPTQNKSIVLTSDDSHGQPTLAAIHGVCAGPGASEITPATGQYPVDAYDWGFCWRSFDALRACALYHVDCQYALGNTPQNRYIGTWSDGVQIIGLKIQTAAPISATPVPSRQAKPPGGTASRPPHAKLKSTRTMYASTTPIVFRGTASGTNGIAFIEVAVVRRTGTSCTQVTSTGAFIRLPGCNRPTSFLFATGTDHWSLKLSRRLHAGSYRVYAWAIDSFGQTPAGYTRANSSAFKVR